MQPYTPETQPQDTSILTDRSTLPNHACLHWQVCRSLDGTVPLDTPRYAAHNTQAQCLAHTQPQR